MYILGRVEPGDEKQCKAEMLSAVERGDVIDAVFIYSPGGAVPPALKIGRYIRTMRLWTSAPYVIEPYSDTQYCPMYVPGAKYPDPMSFNLRSRRGDARCQCASACFLIWAGGVWTEKHSSLHEKILIHRISFDRKEYATWSEDEARARYEAEQRKVEEYLKEMGVQQSVIRRMFSIPSNTVSYLSKAEIDELKTFPPYLQELYDAKCGKDEHCRKQFTRQLYFQAAKKLEAME